MIDKVVGLARDLDILDRVVVVHADLGIAEWPGTRELAEEQAEFYGLKFYAVKRPQGNLLRHVRERGRWPSPKQRYCTSDHKRGQVLKLITHLTTLTRSESNRRVRILQCLGLRAQESDARAKKPPFKHDHVASNGYRHIDQWLPIHDWTVEQVWDTIHRSGCPYHPAYKLGMKRLSCVFCIFAPRSALMIAGQHNPGLLDKYVEVEKEIGHSFKMGLPIVEIKNAIERGERAEACDDWSM